MILVTFLLILLTILFLLWYNVPKRNFNMSDIVYNAIRTPDGTILESTHRHDYKTYTDRNGEEYMVDGGCEYLRRNVCHVPAEELTIYSDAPIEQIREVFTWGTYGKDGKQPLKRVLLKDMSNSHLQNIIVNCTLSNSILKIFQRELEYRFDVDIEILD